VTEEGAETVTGGETEDAGTPHDDTHSDAVPDDADNVPDDDTVPDDTVPDDTDPDDDDTVSDDTADEHVEPDETHAWERIDWIACLVLAAVSLVLVGLHVAAYPTLSPIDEVQHLDYALKAGDFELPGRGDRVGPETIRQVACRGVDNPTYVGPPCDTEDLRYEDFVAAFRDGGINTSTNQFPFYYTVSGVVGRALDGAGLVASPVPAIRMTGALWSGAAWAVMWYLMSLFGLARPNRAIVLALLIVTPLTLFHSATINADAVLMLTGSLALLATVQYERRRLHGALLLATYVALYFVEATVILAIATGAAYLAARTATRADLSVWRRSMPAATLLIVAALRLRIARILHNLWPGQVDTSALDPSTATDPPGLASFGRSGPASVQRPLPRAGSDVDWSLVIEQLGATYTPLTRAYLPPLLREPSTVAFIQLSNWVLIAAMAATAVFAVGASRSSVILARVTTPILLVAGPFYTWSFFYFSEERFPAPGRFALPMIAAIAVAGAAALTTRATRIIAGSVAAASAVNTFVLLVAA